MIDETFGNGVLELSALGLITGCRRDNEELVVDRNDM
jgi:hypothetical protein